MTYLKSEFEIFENHNEKKRWILTLTEHSKYKIDKGRHRVTYIRILCKCMPEEGLPVIAR